MRVSTMLDYSRGVKQSADHVADLAALRAKANSRVVILDANGDSTRDKYGVIPGARLLTSYDGYDVATELPAAKNAKLVFYCANTH